MNAKKVVIVGDIILDHFIYCHQSKNRSECNAPIFKIDQTHNCVGGAANVARFLSSQLDSVSLISVIGDDQKSTQLKSVLLSDLVNVNTKLHTIPDYNVSEKKRIIIHPNTQFARIDDEKNNSFAKLEKLIFDSIESELADSSLVVISDYEKGCLSYHTCQAIIQRANACGCCVFVDGKNPNFSKYTGSFLIKPNREELFAMTKMPVNEVNDALAAANMLRKQAKCEWILATLDKDGMILVGNHFSRYFPSEFFYPHSSVGAGDLVIANIVASFSAGIPIENACQAANRYVGNKLALSNISPSKMSPLHIEDKIVSISQLETYLSHIAPSHTVVFTNGCFDILHPGHIFCLESAAKYGDLLIVGVNSDDSISRIKGHERPINALQDRLYVLSALKCVSFVVPFSEDTPINLIKRIRPDVLVKGGDYSDKEIVGADFVNSYGGRVEITGYYDNHSTSKIIARIGGNSE